MLIAIQGSKNFNDYNVFLRAIGVAMSGLPEDDKYISIYSAGPAKINSMVSEFSNMSERGLKARGKKIKYYKVPPSWVSENMDNVNYFAFLTTPNENNSSLVADAQMKDVEVGIFKY